MKTRMGMAAGILVSFLLAGGAIAAESPGKAMSDSWITTKVKGELAKDKQVSGIHIHVKTVQGVVTLTGKAKTKAEADRAGDDASKIEGVKTVVNNIQVKS